MTESQRIAKGIADVLNFLFTACISMWQTGAAPPFNKEFFIEAEENLFRYAPTTDVNILEGRKRAFRRLIYFTTITSRPLVIDMDGYRFLQDVFIDLAQEINIPPSKSDTTLTA